MGKTSQKGMRTDVMEEITDSKEIIKSNSKAQIQSANSALKKAKEIEQSKTDHVWLSKDKTSRHVSPEKVSEYLEDGWKKMVITKKK